MRLRKTRGAALAVLAVVTAGCTVTVDSPEAPSSSSGSGTRRTEEIAPPGPSGAAFVKLDTGVEGATAAGLLQVGPGNPKVVACIAAGEVPELQPGLTGLTYDATTGMGTPRQGQLVDDSFQHVLGGDLTVKCLGGEVDYGASGPDVNLYVVSLTAAGATTLEGPSVAVPGTSAADIDHVSVANKPTQTACDELSKWVSAASGVSLDLARVVIPPCDEPEPAESPTPTQQTVTAARRNGGITAASRKARRQPART